MASKSVGVVIVTHNSGPQLEDLIAHLGKGSHPESRVWIVDSGSVPSEAPPAHLTDRVILCANYGYGSSVNVAVESGLNTDWIAVLNPDARVTLSTLERLATTASVSGVNVTSALLNEKDPAGGHFASLPTPPWKRRRILHRAISDGFTEVASVQGAVMLIDRDTFDKVQGFDEEYFLYFEEIDLCVRARNSGAVVAYSRDFTAGHLGEASSTSVEPSWRAAERARGKYIYMKKHFGLVSAVLSAVKDILRSGATVPVARQLWSNPRAGLPMPARPKEH